MKKTPATRITVTVPLTLEDVDRLGEIEMDLSRLVAILEANPVHSFLEPIHAKLHYLVKEISERWRAAREAVNEQ